MTTIRCGGVRCAPRVTGRVAASARAANDREPPSPLRAGAGSGQSMGRGSGRSGSKQTECPESVGRLSLWYSNPLKRLGFPPRQGDNRRVTGASSVDLAVTEMLTSATPIALKPKFANRSSHRLTAGSVTLTHCGSAGSLSGVVDSPEGPPMSEFYAAAPIVIRDDLAAAHSRAWARIGHPGTWWDGAQRVAIAAETRHALSCEL